MRGNRIADARGAARPKSNTPGLLGPATPGEITKHGWSSSSSCQSAAILLRFAPMPPSSVQALALRPHPDTPNAAVKRIIARVSRIPGGMLATTYSLEGDIAQIRVPAAGTTRETDELWRHTCFEAFVAHKGAAAYHEFNFAPSSEWAAYTFAQYRERALAGQNRKAEGLDPEIIVRHSATKLELNALIHLDRLSPPLNNEPLTVALAAVVESEDGSLSYWALKHPPGKPDFHHRDAFALELDEIRD